MDLLLALPIAVKQSAFYCSVDEKAPQDERNLCSISAISVVSYTFIVSLKILIRRRNLFTSFAI